MNTIKLALVSALYIAAVTAQAETFNLKDYSPYIGAELGSASVNYDSVAGLDASSFYADSFTLATLHGGLELNERLALEAGYTRTDEKNQSFDFGGGVDGTTQTQFSTIHIDAIGKLPVTKKVKALASLGLAHINVDSSGVVSGTDFSDDDSDFGWRLGAGAQYKLSEKVDVRGMLRYMGTNLEGVEHTLEYAVGVNYKF